MKRHLRNALARLTRPPLDISWEGDELVISKRPWGKGW